MGSNNIKKLSAKYSRAQLQSQLLRRWRQEDHEFKTAQVKLARAYLKNKIKLGAGGSHL
jgi:fructose-bisphosphate aldolase class 1